MIRGAVTVAGKHPRRTLFVALLLFTIGGVEHAAAAV